MAGQPLGLHVSHNQISRLSSSYSEVWSHEFSAAPVFVVSRQPSIFPDNRLAPPDCASSADPHATDEARDSSPQVSTGSLTSTRTPRFPVRNSKWIGIGSGASSAPVATYPTTNDCTRGEGGYGQTVVVGSMQGSLYALPVATGSNRDHFGAAAWVDADIAEFAASSEQPASYSDKLDAVLAGAEEVVAMVPEDMHGGIGTFMCPLGMTPHLLSVHCLLYLMVLDGGFGHRVHESEWQIL